MLNTAFIRPAPRPFGSPCTSKANNQRVQSRYDPKRKEAAMKRITICFDGTWNKPADEKLPADKQVETNVRRFYESVKATGVDGTKQFKRYDDGGGTE